MDKASQRRHLLARLAAERGALLEGLLGLDEPTLVARPVFDDWSVKEILAHVAAWDRWEERTMRPMVAGETPDFSAVQDFAASNAAFVAPWRDRDLEEVLAELVAARSDWVAWLQSLSDEEFFRPRSYSGHPWTFSEVPLQVQWKHDAEHAAQVARWREAEKLKSLTGSRPVLLAALQAARDELLAAAALVPNMERTSRVVCGDWTLKDLLGHVADWEWYGVAGLRQMAAGQPPDPEPIDTIENWNQVHAEARREQSWEVVWEDLHNARQAFLEVLGGIDQTTMAQPFPFAWGPKGTPYQWMVVFVRHDREHAHDLGMSQSEQKHP
jgi:hypothetical protein